MIGTSIMKEVRVLHKTEKKKHAKERFTELEKNLFLLELTIAPQKQD